MIYLDNAATTPLCNAAKDAIMKHFDDYGNPSSVHEFGHKSQLLIEDARETIAKYINAEPDEIFFTSGGSESNTWATRERLFLTSPVEHHSINIDCTDKNSIDIDGNCNLEVVDQEFFGIYDGISWMYVNNEIGAIYPIQKLTQIAHSWGRIIHTDAVQAMGHIPIDVKELNIDMLSASAHKFGGVKGCGFLYVKNGIEIDKLINGGGQENGMRGGTENVLGIISMAAALKDACDHMEERNAHIKRLRDRMLEQLLTVPGSHLNGALENRTVSNINIRFDGVSGSRLVTLCDLHSICISAGSACNEGASEPSHVLKAIGLSDEQALSSIRITIGYQNTETEINTAARMIAQLVERIRQHD